MSLEQVQPVVAMPAARKQTRRRRKEKKQVTAKPWWARVAKGFLARFNSRTPKALRVCESVVLGDKRFVAVIEFEKRRFLVGGAANSLGLLTELEPRRFAKALAKKMAAEETR